MIPPGGAAPVPGQKSSAPPGWVPPPDYHVLPREKKAALRKQYREKFTFVGSDLNKDGHLDRDEWRNYTWNFYLIADVDGDGKLSYAEHISLEVPVTSQGDVWRLDVVEAERVVRRRDKNRDGFITSN